MSIGVCVRACRVRAACEQSVGLHQTVLYWSLRSDENENWIWALAVSSYVPCHTQICTSNFRKCVSVYRDLWGVRVTWKITTCISVCVCLFVYLCVYVCMCVCVYVCVYVCVCVCVYYQSVPMSSLFDSGQRKTATPSSYTYGHLWQWPSLR